MRNFALALVMLELAVGLLAAERLTIGSKAPGITVAKWIQGEPVKEFEKGKVYLVEFWASWCGPCKMSVPHLDALHRKFKDRGVTVIGVDIREDEPIDGVKFLREMKSKMTYRIPQDDMSAGKGKMDVMWMGGIQEDGIPKAFIVNQDGLIAWIGHPLDIEDGLVENILARRLDLKAELARYEKERATRAEVKKLNAELEVALEGKQWNEAEKILTRLEDLREGDDKAYVGLSRVKMNLLKGDFAAAEKTARGISELKLQEARAFDALAWQLATQEGAPSSMLDLALSIGMKASQMEPKNASIWQTLARVYFVRGEKPSAISAQQKAIGLVESGSSDQKQYAAELEDYKAGRIPK